MQEEFDRKKSLRDEQLTDRIGQLLDAIRKGDVVQAVDLVRRTPALLQARTQYADNGCPMAAAAQLGNLELVMRFREAGATDLQHALARACMYNRVEIARYLVEQGADPNGLYDDTAQHYGPVILAACEAFNADGLQLVIDLGADPNVQYKTSDGTITSPLGMLIANYGRNPRRKHACLEVLERAGVAWPDSPVMAVHCGRIDRLEAFYQRDPSFLHRRWRQEELWPSELALSARQIFVLAPLEGGTLLHLAMEYDEFEIAEWLLHKGADVNARCDLSSMGTHAAGMGHTPLFHAMLACSDTPARRVAFLLKHGADPALRATIQHPAGGWDEKAGQLFTDVDALSYARSFEAAPDWMNRGSIAVLEKYISGNHS